MSLLTSSRSNSYFQFNSHLLNGAFHNIISKQLIRGEVTVSYKDNTYHPVSYYYYNNR